ncbi:hypothetical protein K458DRAFT_465116 [Lentithecium fluviatile CBS 122367]|uniref:Uncharacterized protein n=1 Tax=Lentithecium fluviatile CBS 122367 TaxID=1168545 RepID=A0A6G1JEA9_9PLEO|nr:hypothetical protein K458DRAFT_465116 [Lentithecium fluviatile CBS 122367]
MRGVLLLYKIAMVEEGLSINLTNFHLPSSIIFPSSIPSRTRFRRDIIAMGFITGTMFFSIPFLGLTTAVPATRKITTSILLPRELPNSGTCIEPYIDMHTETQVIGYQPSNWDHFGKDFGLHSDFYLVARYICAKLKDGCEAPPETVQTCWDSYGRASELKPDPALPEVDQMRQRVDKFNNGMRGLDGISKDPNENPNDHYEVEIWAGPSTVKFYADAEDTYTSLMDEMFTVKDNGDFEKKTKENFRAKCSISTQGYTDKYANGKTLTNAMKKLLMHLLGTENIIRHGKERTAVKCNGWLTADGSCCYTNTKDPATGKCPDGYTYKNFYYSILPTEFSMRATIEPNNGRGNGYMKWLIECKDPADQKIRNKDCDWCMKMRLEGQEKDTAQKLFTENLGLMNSTIKQDCNWIPCQN